MSIHRQLPIPAELDTQAQNSGEHQRVSNGEALDRLERLNAPTADIEQMLAEIEAGRH